MKILSAVGLGIAIVILKLLLPHPFRGFEDALTAFFNVASAALDRVLSGIQHSGPTYGAHIFSP